MSSASHYNVFPRAVQVVSWHHVTASQSKWKSKIVRRMLSAIKPLDEWQLRSRNDAIQTEPHETMKKNELCCRMCWATHWRLFISFDSRSRWKIFQSSRNRWKNFPTFQRCSCKHFHFVCSVPALFVPYLLKSPYLFKSPSLCSFSCSLFIFRSVFNVVYLTLSLRCSSSRYSFPRCSFLNCPFPLCSFLNCSFHHCSFSVVSSNSE